MNDSGSCDWCWYLSFSDFLRPDLSPWGYRNMFSSSTVLFESKRTELGNSNQETSPSRKNSAISCMEGSMQLFPVMWVFQGSWVPFAMTHQFSMSHKTYFKDWCLMDSQSIFLILTSFCLNTRSLWVTQLSKM